MSLLSLSEELLTAIISQLPSKTLYAVSLTSRTLSRLATPPLYSNIKLLGSAADSGTKYLIPLTYTLFANRSLATLVHSFTIRDVLCHVDDTPRLLLPGDAPRSPGLWDRQGWPKWESPERLKEVIHEAVERVGYRRGEADEVTQTIEEGNDERAILSILLPLLPRLRKLDLAIGYFDEECVLLKTFNHVSARQPPFDSSSDSNTSDKTIPFQELEDVMITGYDDKYPSPPDFFGALIGFPSLKKIYGWQLGNNDQDEPTSSFLSTLRGTSSLEFIEMRRSQLHADDLKLLLAAPKALKTLIYEVGHPWAWYDLKIKDIMVAVSQQKESLEQLVLTGSQDLVLKEEAINSGATISFAEFENLTYLKTACVFLDGKKKYAWALAAAFPKSLKTLHLTYFLEAEHFPSGSENFYTTLLSLFTDKNRYLPKLEKVVLESLFKNNEYKHWDTVKDIVRVLGEQGVDVELVDAEFLEGYDGTIERGWGLNGEVEWGEVMNNKMKEREVLDPFAENKKNLELESGK